MFGCRFFYTRQRSVKTIPEYVWVGIKSTGILLAKIDTREFLREWTFEKIQRWGYSPNAFYFQLKSMADSIHGAMWEFSTPEGEEMMLILNTYMKYIIDDLDSNLQGISTQIHSKSSTTDLAAIKIQAFFRGYSFRKRLHEAQKILAVRTIERHWRKLRKKIRRRA